MRKPVKRIKNLRNGSVNDADVDDHDELLVVSPHHRISVSDTATVIAFICCLVLLESIVVSL